MTDAAADAEIQAALKNPSTMDPREPIAISRAILDRTPLIASEDEARERARIARLRALGPDLVRLWHEEIRRLGVEEAEEMLEALDLLVQPTSGDLDAATRAIHTDSIKLVAVHSQRQIDAVKALDWNAAIREVMLPFLTELGLQINVILREHVEPSRQKAAAEKVANAIHRTLGMVSQASQRQNPVPGTNR
jgi:hypothetical protein